MVVETDWPAVCSGTTMSESSVAISAAGQSTWVAGIRTVLQGLSGGHGVGIVYWEPQWIGNAGLGSSCAVREGQLHLLEHINDVPVLPGCAIGGWIW